MSINSAESIQAAKTLKHLQAMAKSIAFLVIITITTIYFYSRDAVILSWPRTTAVLVFFWLTYELVTLTMTNIFHWYYNHSKNHNNN